MNIHDLPSLEDGYSSNAKDSRFVGIDKHQHYHQFHVKAQVELLSQLRDRLVEVTQKGNSHGSRNGLFLSLGYVDELSFLATAIRLLWNNFSRLEMYQFTTANATRREQSSDSRTIDVPPAKVNDFTDWKKLYGVGVSIRSLILEVFPVKDESGNPLNRQQYNVMNASLCCALSELGSNLRVASVSQKMGERVDEQAKWVDTVFSYLLPRLECEERDSNDEDNKGAYRLMITGRDEVSTLTLLKVIGQLLLKQEHKIAEKIGSQYLLDDDSKRVELLSKFADVFFPVSAKSAIGDSEPLLQLVSPSLSSSAAGRRSAILLTALVSQYFRTIQWNSGMEPFLAKLG